MSACFHPDQNLRARTQKALSNAASLALGCLRFSAASCWRRARFSRSRLRRARKSRRIAPKRSPMASIMPEVASHFACGRQRRILLKSKAGRILANDRGQGHVVGFMGDGINDAPALRAADIGISVDTATDIAKESADLILLEKDLMGLEGGVVEGRKVFANIFKYIRMGASSNFGNMFSVLGASAFLPFIPMAPIQVLTNNLLYDFSQVPIPVDAVDEEQGARPRPWNIAEITRFILYVGPISSIFDYTTFFVMLWVFNCWDPAHASLFQTGWFVESLMTQTLIIHVIRTNKIPFLQSTASQPLTLTTLAIMAFGIWLPYSPAASALGFTHLPSLY